ncbi:MAG: HAD family hydrolase [Spirochaetia bacterium]|jgi:phosphoglycolate phosphatase
MTHTAVLFDLDGTLLDTLEDLGDSMNVTLASLGYPAHPIVSYRYFVGDGVENLVRRALPQPAGMDEAVVSTALPLMRAEYARRWKDKSRLYDGVPELLDGLSARGVKLAVLSNKPHPATVDVVNHFFSRWRFDAVLGARHGVPIKPDAGAALEVCRLLAIPAGSFLYLGDTNTDMFTARAAGMFAVGALWGFRTAEELKSAGAQALVRRPEEVLDLLG